MTEATTMGVAAPGERCGGGRDARTAGPAHPDATAAPGDLAEIWPASFSSVDLRRWLGEEADGLVRDVVAAGVNRPIRDLLERGGKRWRVTVGRLAYRVAGGLGPAPAGILEVAELLHEASLVVDDIEDDAAQRRGGLPAHLAHGLPVALNAANAAYFRALAALRPLLPDAARLRALDMLAEELFAAHLGQALDLSLGAVAKAGVPVAEGHYLALARAKTGALVRIAARLGAIAAGADPDVERRLAAWAGELGIAYQIRDDADDVGDGSDLDACRLSHPLLLALEQAGPGERDRLRRALGGTTDPLAAEDRRETSLLLRRLGVAEQSRRAARRAARRALAALDALPASEARAALAALTLALAGEPEPMHG